MKRLSRYVGVFVLGAIALVLLVVLSLDVIAALIDGLEDIDDNYRFSDVLQYIVLTLPARIYDHLAFSSLIGCLLGLGVLAGNAELVIMRAAGVSLLRISGFVLRPVLLMIIAGVLMGEFVVPYTDQLAESRRMLRQGEQGSVGSTSGVWNREGNEFIHFNAVYPNGRLFGVSRYRFGEDRVIEEVSFAAQATYFEDHWVEERGAITRFNEDSTETDTFLTRRWETGLSPDFLQLISMTPESLPMVKLYQYASYLDDQGQTSSAHWLAFWGKLLQPLTVLGLVLVAVSFVFGPLREATMGFRIFSGVVVGIAFQTVQQLLGPSSIVFGFPAFWAVLAPAIACALVGVILLHRAA